jgi:N4-(beta-N-acetylglucosaminyl)-L-asparaginase
MERTDHIMLVGPGATRFGELHGIPRENLLTERARTAWLAWKETMSDRDSWGPGLDSPEWKERVSELLPRGLTDTEKGEWVAWIREVILDPPTGTINCLAVNEKGDISGTTTTSGLAWKIMGRRFWARACGWITTSGRRAPPGAGKKISASPAHTRWWK